VLGRLVDGMNLESVVGEVNHHVVLIQVAVHKNLGIHPASSAWHT